MELTNDKLDQLLAKMDEQTTYMAYEVRARRIFFWKIAALIGFLGFVGVLAAGILTGV